MIMNPAALWINTTFAEFDELITIFIHKLYILSGEFFTPFFEFISFLGHDGIPLIIISVALILIKKTRRFGTAMLLSIAIGALITNCCLKIMIARARPYADNNSIYYQLWRLVGMNTESDKSFPSGHTTAAFAFCMAIYLTGNKKISWLAFSFGVLMAISRIYLVVHYPSDVIAGIFVGLFSGVIGTTISIYLPYKYYGNELFYTKTNKKIEDESYTKDYVSNEKIGRICAGSLGLYYKDLGKKYFLSYDEIHNAYIKIECVQPDDSPAYYYYRLILRDEKRIISNLIFDKEEDVKKSLDIICSKNKKIIRGFVE